MRNQDISSNTIAPIRNDSVEPREDTNEREADPRPKPVFGQIAHPSSEDEGPGRPGIRVDQRPFAFAPCIVIQNALTAARITKITAITTAITARP